MIALFHLELGCDDCATSKGHERFFFNETATTTNRVHTFPKLKLVTAAEPQLQWSPRASSS